MYYLLPCILSVAEATFIAAKCSDQIMGMLVRMITAWKQLPPFGVFLFIFATSFFTFFDLAKAHFAESAATLKQCGLASLAAAIVVAACTAVGHLITRWSLNTEVEQEVVEEEENEDIAPIKRGPGC